RAAGGVESSAGVGNVWTRGARLIRDRVRESIVVCRDRDDGRTYLAPDFGGDGHLGTTREAEQAPAAIDRERRRIATLPRDRATGVITPVVAQRIERRESRVADKNAGRRNNGHALDRRPARNAGDRVAGDDEATTGNPDQNRWTRHGSTVPAELG